MKYQTEKFPTYSTATRLLLAALVAASLVTGCGGDSDPADAGAGDTAVQTPDATAQNSPSGSSAALAARHSDPSTYSTRDSAGIQIIETGGSEWTPETAWTVDPQPLASLGGDSTGGSSLHGAGQMVGLSDGSFVVAYPRGSQILWFGSDGNLIRAAGRMGRAPGGFMALGSLLAMPGDSVLVVDPEVERASVFGPDGEFARQESLDIKPAGSPSAVAVLRDGSILATRQFAYREGMSAGLNRDSLPLVVLQPGDGFSSTASVFPTSQYWLFGFGEGLAGGEMPFGSESHVAATADGFWFGSGDTSEVTFHGTDGRLQRILRWDGAAEPLPAERVEQFEADAMATAGSGPASLAEMRNFLQDLPFPETIAHVGGMIVDADGALWIGPYHVWTESAGGWWAVFDPTGKRLGMVELPAGFEIRAIGTDRIYGVWTDEAGVESVLVYALNR